MDSEEAVPKLSVIHYQLSVKKAVNIFVGDAGEKGVVGGGLEGSGFFRDALKDGGEFARRLFDAQFDQAETRTLVEDDDEQRASDDTDKDVFVFAFVGERREFLLADELRHAVGRRDVARRERCQTCRIETGNVAFDGDGLPVLVNQKGDFGCRIATQFGKHGFNLAVLLFTNDDGCFSHFDAKLSSHRGGVYFTALKRKFHMPDGVRQ